MTDRGCIRVTGPGFVAELLWEDILGTRRVIRAASKLKYMTGWTGKMIAEECRRRGWSWERKQETTTSEPSDT